MKNTSTHFKCSTTIYLYVLYQIYQVISSSLLVYRTDYVPPTECSDFIESNSSFFLFIFYGEKRVSWQFLYFISDHLESKPITIFALSFGGRVPRLKVIYFIVLLLEYTSWFKRISNCIVLCCGTSAKLEMQIVILFFQSLFNFNH